MDHEIECPIWKTRATIIGPNNRDGKQVDSPRAGGEYFVTGTAMKMLSSFDEHEKVRLTSWLIEQRRLGAAHPEISSDTLNTVKNRRALSVRIRADNLLRYLDKKSDLLGHIVKFYANENKDTQYDFLELLGWTDSREYQEIITLIKYCNEQNWIEHRETVRNNAPHNNVHELMMKPLGYTRLSELDGANPDSIQGFVAMWFDDSVEKAYREGFEPAIKNCGYEPIRIDQVEHIDKVDDRIIAEIRRSRFVVADFTSEPEKPRGGVYYEAGFAHGLNIPVIFTCRKDLINHVHFDTRQFNHIVWDTPDDLRDKLTARISAVIGDGPQKE